MDHRHGHHRGDLGDAADVTRRHDRRAGACDIRRLAVAQASRQLRLQDVVDPGRAAAEVALGDGPDLETRLRQQGRRAGIDLLAVLQGTGGVVGDAELAGPRHRRQADLADELQDVAGERGGIHRIRVADEPMAIGLQGRAAAGGRRDDGGERPGPRPRRDVGGGETTCLPCAAQMFRERSAAALAVGQHNLEPGPRDQPDRRPADRRRHGGLHTAPQQGDPAAAHALRGIGRLGLGGGRGLRDEAQQRRQRVQLERLESRAKGTHDPPKRQRPVQVAGSGQDMGDRPPQEPLEQGPPVVFLYVGAAVVDQLGVVDAGRAGGDAGQARQAAVDVGHRLLRRGAARLQHGLDQLDPAPRTVTLIAQQDIGRTGRRAKTAMHALADLRMAGGDVGIGELGRSEQGLHQSAIRPGLSTPAGSNAALTRAVRAASGPASGSNARPSPR